MESSSTDGKVNFIVAHEKHGKRYIHANDNTIDTAAMILLEQRIEAGWWYYDEDDDAARSALAADIAVPQGASWEFLDERTDYEYERVTAEQM